MRSVRLSSLHHSYALLQNILAHKYTRKQRYDLIQMRTCVSATVGLASLWGYILSLACLPGLDCLVLIEADVSRRSQQLANLPHYGLRPTAEEGPGKAAL